MAALSAIAAAPDRPAFPTIVDCPICRKNSLHLFDDLFTDGIWLHCTSCEAHGDIITFGSAVWNLSLPETITKFSELKVLTPDEAERLIGAYTKFYASQSAAETFILDTKTQVWNHGDDTIACILRNLGVYQEIPACHTLIGVAHHEQVTAVCTALGRSKPTRLRENGAHIVFPFYDLPGRLTGFSLLQYNDRSESSQTFIPISGYKRKKPEAGYFLLHATLAPPPKDFKTNQFISDDLLWVLKAQCTHLKHEFKLLPLVGSYTGREANSFGLSWQAFPPATRIFESVACTPELVSRAEAAKGYAAFGVNAAQAYRVTHRSEPVKKTMARLQRTWRKAHTWRAALTAAIANQSELTAATFCSRLTVPHDKLNKFLTNCQHQFSDGFTDRVLNSVKTALAAPIRAHRRWVIIERDSGWWTQSGLQICNAKPTIKKVIQSDTGERIYCGEALIDGQIFEFTESAAVVEQLGLLRYLGSVLSPAGKFVVYDRPWNRKSHLLAMQLHPPELVTVSSKIGWDHAAKVFRFAQYEITQIGELQRTPQIPGARTTAFFPEPITVAPIQIRELLTPTNDNSLVWAATAAIISNLLAPAFAQDCIATALTPELFDGVARVGEALNCKLTQLTTIRKNTIGSAIDVAVGDAAWPAFLLNLFNDTAFSRVIPRYHLQPIFARMTPTCAAAAASYGWQTINAPPLTSVADYSVLKYTLPAYIQKCLKTQLQHPIRGRSLSHAILDDLHTWLLQTYGTSFNKAFAESILKTDADAHNLLKAELKHAINQNRIDVIPHPRKKTQSVNYFLRRATSWWLNRRAIDNYFYVEKSTPINWLHIVKLLAQNGILLEEAIIYDLPGVWVEAEWCDDLLDNSSRAIFKQESG